MSQQEIIDLLQKEKEPLTRSQIADLLEQDRIKISHILKKLIEQNLVDFIEFDRIETSRRTNQKVDRRTRFYFYCC
jgi:Mn-dependent DtxR family transcriptional regulator